MSVVVGERSIAEKWSPVMAIVVANVATGSVNALVKKALAGGVNHMVIGAYRLAISAFILAPLAYFLERKARPKITFRLMIDHFISGLLGASLLQFFFMLGLLYTSATVAGAFVSMLPAITFALSLILRTESVRNLKGKAGMLKVMGTFICVSGAMLLTFYKGPQISHFHSHPEGLHHNNNNKTDNWLLGCLYATIGTTFLSLWMIFQGTLNTKYPCKYTSTCLMSVFGSFQCALLSLYKRRDAKDWVMDDRFVIFVIIYAGIVGQALSTVATSWSIKRVGAVFASTFSPVILISATLFDFLILHTPLYLGRKTRPKLTFRLLVDHFFSGLLGASLMQFFFLLGLSYTSATVSCALVSMLPAITFTLALIFRTENVKNLKTKAGMLKVMGTLICIGGALFLTFYKGPQISNPHSNRGAALHHNDNDQDKAKNWLLGCLYLTIGTTLLSIWMLFQGTLNIKYPCKYSSTCLMSVFAAFQCALLSLYKGRDAHDWVISDKFVITVIIYAGVVGQAMSTVATSWSIKKLGAVFASTFTPITLISATLFDFLILHTPLYLGSVIGAVVAVMGLYVFLWGKNNETESSTTLPTQMDNEGQHTNNTNTNNNNSKDCRSPV
ncbi:unnamed protein product [Eruca vesicaria subsp. sativa]|uniref:EamA domain-containing protein n=1 Tax=Eruca vesicaria subsp. sativa TaxID=29727 RepID=A0ABC8J9K6_ERUVS|nr:unnamed protein product [Eruca vesicaria subsp. sativa]